MGNALKHRGPDDEGSYFDNSEKFCIGLGHKRLSILDLSIAARQPMCNEDGNIWITYNGEVYNFQELRTELIAKGHSFKSNSDTEVAASRSWWKNRKGVFSRYPKTITGSWRESDRG